MLKVERRPALTLSPMTHHGLRAAQMLALCTFLHHALYLWTMVGSMHTVYTLARNVYPSKDSGIFGFVVHSTHGCLQHMIGRV